MKSINLFFYRYFEKLKTKKLLLQISLFGFLCDLINMAYLIKYLLPKYLTDKSIANILLTQGVSIQDINPSLILELKGMMLKSMSIIFVGFLLFHGLLYFLVSKRKKWPMKYIRKYSFTAFVLTILTANTYFEIGLTSLVLLLMTTLIYYFNFTGIKYIQRKIGKKLAQSKV